MASYSNMSQFVPTKYLKQYSIELLDGCLCVGLSLIWVSVMGIIIIYMYGLLIFAFYRYAVIPADGYQVFCRTLYECVITVLRYGMIGDLSGVSAFLALILSACCICVYMELDYTRLLGLHQQKYSCRIKYIDCVLQILILADVALVVIQHLQLSAYNEDDFFHFGLLTLIQCSFFVIFTTVGLNVILGIIVDTFSQLRDLKVCIVKNMQ